MQHKQNSGCHVTTCESHVINAQDIAHLDKLTPCYNARNVKMQEMLKCKECSMLKCIKTARETNAHKRGERQALVTSGRHNWGGFKGRKGKRKKGRKEGRKEGGKEGRREGEKEEGREGGRD